MITYLQIIVEKSKILNTLQAMGNICGNQKSLQEPDQPGKNYQSNEYSKKIPKSPSVNRGQQMPADRFEKMAEDLSQFFFQEVKNNIQKLKEKIQKIQESKDDLRLVEVEKYSFEKSEKHYRQISELKYKKKALEKDPNTQIVQQMLEPYALADTFIKEKRILVIDMQYLFNVLLKLLKQGQIHNGGQFRKRITFLGEHKESSLSPLIEDLAQKIKFQFKNIQRLQQENEKIEQIKEEELKKMKIEIEEHYKSLIQQQSSKNKQLFIKIDQLEEQLRQHKQKIGETPSLVTDTTPHQASRILDKDRFGNDEEYKQKNQIISEMTVSLENRNQQVKTLSKYIDEKNIKNTELSHLLENNEKKIQQYLLRIRELEDEKNSLEEKLSGELVKAKESIFNVDVDLNERRGEIEKLRGQISAKDSSLKEKNKQVSSLELRIKELTEVSNKQKKEMEMLERQTHLTGEQIKKISQISIKKDEKITNQQSKISDLQNGLASAQIKLESWQEQLDELRSRKQDPSSEIEELKQLNKTLMTELEGYRSSKRIRSKSFIDHKVLFTGYILDKKKQTKMFLIDVIERNMMKVISRTDKVYEFARDRKNIFHEFIDGKSNLVIIIETAKNNLLAGYYSGKYAEKTLMDQEGLLISLTNFKYYQLNNFKNNPKKNKKETKPMCGMVYDNYFLIFGNSEIRIRHGQSKIYSNFGLGSSYFMSQGDKVNAFLCEGEKTNEVELINYEIYELFFDEEVELWQT